MFIGIAMRPSNTTFAPFCGPPSVHLVQADGSPLDELARPLSHAANNGECHSVTMGWSKRESDMKRLSGKCEMQMQIDQLWELLNMEANLHFGSQIWQEDFFIKFLCSNLFPVSGIFKIYEVLKAGSDIQIGRILQRWALWADIVPIAS